MRKLGNSNKKMKIILLLVIFFIMIGIICILLFQRNTQGTENTNSSQQINGTVETSSPQTFKQVENYDIYYTVKGILNNYITMIKEANGDEQIETGKLQQSREEIITILEEEAIDAIYHMFDEQYVEEVELTEDSIREAVQEYRQQGDYSRNVNYNLRIEEMYEGDITTQIKLILTKFTINDIEENLLIKLDMQNDTYSMFGQEYLNSREYNKDTEIAKIEIDTNSVTSNNYNHFDYVNTNDQYIVNQYFSEYQTKLLHQVGSAYDMLDKEYRENKYESQQEFTEYVEQNYDSLKSNYLSKYLINQFEEYKEYVCLDANNHYYIFIERSLTDYSVILDTYTVDLIDFTQIYDSANISSKVGMNVEKVLDAINDRDYRYVYNKLDETFRNNTYGSLENFEVYMEENFYEENDIEYLEFSEEGDTYIYRAKIKNAAEDQSEQKHITIIMKLLEGTDFDMSFSIE